MHEEIMLLRYDVTAGQIAFTEVLDCSDMTPEKAVSEGADASSV